MLMSSVRIDVSPLRQLPAFRNLWLSSLITRFGSMITYVAAPYQIKVMSSPATPPVWKVRIVSSIYAETARMGCHISVTLVP